MFNIRRDLLLPLTEIISKTDITKQYRFLKSSEFWSRDEIENYQRNKLKELFKHCFNNVKYYNELFNKYNVNIESNYIFDEIKKLPILTKKDIINNYNDLISEDFKNRLYTTGATGGSTGEPLKFLFDLKTQSAGWAPGFRGFEYVGYNLGDKIYTFSGYSLVKNRKVLSKQFVWERIIMNNYKYSSIDVNEEKFLYFYNKLIKLRPKIIRGYPSSIYVLAKYIDTNDFKIPKIKCVFSTGEVLLNEYRNYIEEVFNAKVYNGYGAGDGGFNSYECTYRNGMHISEENAYIEIIKNEKVCVNEEIGDVIVTSLNNYVFPFIRYKVGDMAYIKNEPCSCGRNTLLFGEVLGRSGRILRTKQGNPVSPTSLDVIIFKGFDDGNRESVNLYNRIEKFHFTQDEIGDLLIRLKLKENKDFQDFDYLIDNFSSVFKGSDVKIEFVKEIKPLHSGKEDFITSYFTKYE